MTQPDTVTDISDKSWDDLINADRSVLQELAKERESLDGRWGNEKIAKELLRDDGREDDIPDEYRDGEQDDEEEGNDDVQNDDTETASGDDTEGEPEADEEFTDDREPEDDEDDDEARNEQLGNHDDGEPRDDGGFIIEASRISEWLDYIDPLVDEAKVHLNEGGFRTRAVDPANVGMVDAQLEYRAFESYTLGGEGVIGVNVNRLGDVLGGADAGQLVNIDYDAQTRNLVVAYGGHTFTLSLIDPASIRKEPDLPDLDLPVRAELDAADLTDAVGYADALTDHIRLSARPNPDEFVIHGEGDTDDYEWVGEGGEDVEFLSPPDAEYVSLYSLDYVKDMVKPYTAGETITVEIGQEFPLVMATPIEDDDTEIGSATYMLAPRIQSD